jgi:4-hydroxybenzoate polyprenyltransferase
MVSSSPVPEARDRGSQNGARGRSRTLALASALRPHQWVKNVLVIVPAIAAHRVHETAILLGSVITFVCFCLAASGNYLANDVMDAAADRVHPRKRLRAVASGALPLTTARTVSALLMTGALLLAWFALSRWLALIVLIYIMVSAAYSVRLKREPVVDVFVLAALYVVRVLAGAVATGIPVSTWFLAFAMFLFLSLAFIKRYTELFLMKGALAGRGYIAGDDRWMPAIGISSGYMAVLVLALYVNSPEVVRLYHRPLWLGALCPLLLFWVTRLWFRASREIVHDDPVVEALSDPTTYVLGALSLAIMYAAI